MYKKSTIYYFTGTGNSYRVASWMGETATTQGINSCVASISGARPAEEIENGSENLLGLVFPTHGFTAPWHVIHFALRLPRRRGTHAFVTPTRAGTKIIGFLPGMEGTAGYLIALILLLKGYILQGVQAVDMPSNWMALHWGLQLAHPFPLNQQAFHLYHPYPLLSALPRTRDAVEGFTGGEGINLPTQIQPGKKNS